MKRSMNKNIENTRDLFNGQVNGLCLRFVELFSYFAIVFVARIFSDFSYRSEALLIVFRAATFLQYNAEWIWEMLGRRKDWTDEKIKQAVLWYTSYVDIAVVVSLIYFTGTIESPFLLLLAVPLYFVSNFFPWKVTAKYFFYQST